MKYFEKGIAYLRADKFMHIQDEFRRHASASAIFAFFPALLSAPLLFADRLPRISPKFFFVSGAVFLFFSLLPDILRFFCGTLKLQKINALSHSFVGALLFSGLFMLAIMPLNVWKLPLFVLGFLGYMLHLFVDSAESAIEWWVSGIEKILSSQPFSSLKRAREKQSARHS